VAGNTSGNDGGRVVETVTGQCAPSVTSGEAVYFLRDGAVITMPSARGNTCRYTFKTLGSGGRVIAAPGESIDRGADLTLGAGQTVEMLSDGNGWWSL